MTSYFRIFLHGIHNFLCTLLHWPVGVRGTQSFKQCLLRTLVSKFPQFSGLVGVVVLPARHREKIFAFYSIFFLGGGAVAPPQWALAPSFTRFLDHTQPHTTVGRTPLDEWSVRRRDLYLTTHNTHNRQTSMSPGGIRTHDLSRRAAVDLRLRPRGHWDRRFIPSLGQKIILPSNNFYVTDWKKQNLEVIKLCTLTSFFFSPTIFEKLAVIWLRW